ncbi:hypothetical protein [Sphingomonas sp. LaA6.9]|uniref:hypothetical protein n=1 Tax=Sphingomonas sp. LaA6.9 TaxID=2919914 RepID=UPI001F4FEE2D|nr:hypothetical protein [Sphingomonas sp. LaA6.9]MCJ8158474.1 hypothetical protein [Sphingomonas sp. LaA6.9]
MLSIPLVMATWQVPAFAQADEPAASEEGAPCKLSQKKKQGSSMLGGILGGIAGSTLGRGSVGSFIPFNLVSTTLTNAIACKLDKDEQKKAAKATDVAISKGVGGSESWTSTTREGVSGTSTVTAQAQGADGADCVTVDDVIIVNGEETIASKRMCRAQGGSGYAVV